MSNRWIIGVLVVLVLILGLLLIRVQLTQIELIDQSETQAVLAATNFAVTLAVQDVTREALLAEATNAEINAEATRRALYTEATQAAATTVALAEEVRAVEGDAAGLRGRALATSAEEVYATGDHLLALRLAYEAASIPEAPGFADALLAEIAFEPGVRSMISRPDWLPAMDVTEDLLAFHDENNLRVLDTTTHEEIALLEVGEFVSAIAIGETYIAAGLFDGDVVIFSRDNWDEYTRIRTPTNVRALDLQRALLVYGAGEFDGADVVVMNVQTDETIFRGRVDTRLFDVAFSHDASMIATSGDSRSMVDVYDVETGELLHHFEGQRGANAADVAFTPDDEALVAAMSGGTAFVWDLETGETLHRLRPSGQYDMRAIAVNEDYIVAGGGELNTLTLWTRDGDLVRTISLETGATDGATPSVDRLAFVRDQIVGLKNGDGSHIFTIDLQPVRPLITYDGEFYADYSDMRGGMAVMGSNSGSVQLTDLTTGDVLWEQTPYHDEARVSVALGADVVLSSATDDNLIDVWNLTTGENIITHDATNGPVGALAVAPDGKTFLAGGVDGRLRLMDLETGEILFYADSRGGGIRSVAFSPDGKQVAFGTSDGEVGVYDVETGEELHNFTPMNDASHLRFSGDGERLVVTASYRGFSVWDLTPSTSEPSRNGVSLESEIFFRGEESNRYEVAIFHPSNPSIVAATVWPDSQDSIVEIWDVDTGELLMTIDAPDLYLQNLTYDGEVLTMLASDGAYLASGFMGELEVLAVLAPVGNDLLRWVENHRYLRDLTCDERRVYSVPPGCQG